MSINSKTRAAAAKPSAKRPRRAARQACPPATSPPSQPVALDPPSAPPPPPARALPAGKLGTLVSLLSRPQGATIDAMSQATAWQAHSVRGALSGALKKDRGYAITSEPADSGRVYRIAAEPTP